MTTKTDKDKPKEVNYNRSAYIVLGVGAFAVVFLPIFLTQFPSIFDFTETGQIGDTIGGITAPFVGLVGAMLVYYSFKQQMIANENQMESIKDIKKENLDNHYINIANDFSKSVLSLIEAIEIDFIRDEMSFIYYGSEGLDEFYECLLASNANDIEITITEKSEKLLFSLNRNNTVLLVHINKISSKEVRDIYLGLFGVQINILIYDKICHRDIDVSESHKYYDIWKATKINLFLAEITP